MERSQAKRRLVAALILFGTIGVFVRLIPLPSGVIALARGVVGTAFLLLSVSLRRARVSLKDVKRNLALLCASGACIGFNWILLFEAYRYTTVATATLCYYLAPIFVIVVSPLLFSERLTRAKCLCVLAALFGMVLVSGVLHRGAGGTSLVGVLFGVGAAVLYAGVILLNKRLTGILALDRTIMQLGVASVTLLPYVLLVERPTLAALTPRTVLLLLTVGILHTGVAYALYFGSIAWLPAQTVALFSYIEPVVAILLSALLLHEPMTLAGAIGAALVLGATFVSERLDARAAPARKE